MPTREEEFIEQIGLQLAGSIASLDRERRATLRLFFEAREREAAQTVVVEGHRRSLKEAQAKLDVQLIEHARVKATLDRYRAAMRKEFLLGGDLENIAVEAQKL